MGHIINLTVQAFLFDDDDSEISISLQPTEAEKDTWRAKGALGKLHNIVVFVQRSPQRIAAFIELSGGKKLERDNSTRWNSWAHMIACALRPEIRRAIKIFCQEFELDQDALDLDDWIYIQAVYDLLKIFEQVTLDIEGSFGTLGKVIMTMDFLLNLFEEVRQSTTDEYLDEIKGMCNYAWNKLNKYYNLTGTSVVYIAAVVLDPRVKWVYFTKQWPDWIAQAKQDILTYWNEFYKGSHTGIDHQAHVLDTDQSEISKFRRQNNPQDDEVVDQYELYCITPRLPERSKQSAIDWWKEESQQEAYPDLSRWAIDVLSIPAMSDAPERLFSRAANTLHEGRAQLIPETVEALESIKSWSLQGIGRVEDIE